jgi:CRISPR-associated protein Cas2
MLIVVSYDIPDDARRAKVCEILKDHGEHVQYSVFECDLDERRLAELKAELAALAKERKDSIRYYRLCERCAGRVETIGRQGLTRED